MEGGGEAGREAAEARAVRRTERIGNRVTGPAKAGRKSNGR